MRRTLYSAFFSALLVASACGVSAHAQEPSAPPQDQTTAAQASGPDAATPARHKNKMPNGQRELKRMSKDLNLSSDQHSKIEAILTARDQQIASAEADTTMSAKQQKKRSRSAQMDADTQIQAVLNADQKTQYDQMKATMAARKHGGKAGASTSAGSDAPAAPPAPAQDPQ